MEASLQVRFAALTDVGRVRAANEDNQGQAEYPWGQVYVVCDGMGGHVGGAKASSIAVASILEYLARDSAQDPVETLRKAISFANEQIYATALNQRELKGMGTTCVVLLQKETGLWLAHVGDSRAYIFTDGKLYKLSRDHSFVQKLVDQGTIAEEDAESHPRKNELLRALGINGDVDVEVTADPIYPKKGDLFLLCSDGLYGMTGDTGIQKVLAGAGSLEDKAKLLIEEANEAGGTDNITVQLIHVTASPHVANRYQAIKPPLNTARTMPLEQSAGAIPPSNPEPSFLERHKFPLIFVVVALLAVGSYFGITMAGKASAKAEREKFVKDSTRKDSITKADVIADSLEALKNDTTDGPTADSVTINKSLPKEGKSNGVQQKTPPNDETRTQTRNPASFGKATPKGK
jgi:serine/threonine protein phosphatase PrpC